MEKISIQDERTNIELVDEIDLRELLLVILDGRYIIMSLVFCFAVLSMIYALLQTPIYRANSLSLLKRQLRAFQGLIKLLK